MALSISPRGIAFGPVLRWKDPCLCGASKWFIDKPGSGSFELLGSYQRGYSHDERRKDIASLDLQITEITSFVLTARLLQRLT